MNTPNSQPTVNWDEVAREAHELSLRHGWNAHIYAAKLAEKAESVGDLESAQFWKAVSSSLTPRE